jgi:hypothetical protein
MPKSPDKRESEPCELNEDWVGGPEWVRRQPEEDQVAVEFNPNIGLLIDMTACKFMEEERLANPEPSWWYLSYASKEDGAWQGGAVVLGYGFTWAVHEAHLRKITPSGHVEVAGHRIPPEKVPEEKYRNRLLTKAELESFFGRMMTINEYAEEHKNAN